MCRKSRRIWTGTIATSFVALALIATPNFLRGSDARKPTPPGKLVMHEWGTFTSFAGSNGVNLEYRPIVANDLPPFVMNPFSQPGSKIDIFTKNRFVALQRMETPVAYFYTDTPRTVKVRVDFPQGMLTEWYPVVKKFESGKDLKTNEISGHAYLDWGAVRLTPPKEFANVKVRGPGIVEIPGILPKATNVAIPASLPKVGPEQHYGQARETDSAIVETIDANRGSHFEKFLFYRGLGNFELPIKLIAQGNDRFEISNSADVASGALLLVRIENNRVRYVRLEPVSAHASIECMLPTTESTADGLAEVTVRELVAVGLYEKEALAMVNTWRTSWFGENGTRLLYLVPEKETDALLPLKVDPAPDERVRVLVGRLETLTPEDCQHLVSILVGDNSGGKPSDKAVTTELKSLGRFAEPAIQFAIGQTSNSTSRERLTQILSRVRSGK